MWRAPGICCWAFNIPYIYINDIVKASNFNTVLYVDDINLHISGKKHEKTVYHKLKKIDH